MNDSAYLNMRAAYKARRPIEETPFANDKILDSMAAHRLLQEVAALANKLQAIEDQIQRALEEFGREASRFREGDIVQITLDPDTRRQWRTVMIESIPYRTLAQTAGEVSRVVGRLVRQEDGKVLTRTIDLHPHHRPVLVAPAAEAKAFLKKTPIQRIID